MRQHIAILRRKTQGILSYILLFLFLFFCFLALFFGVSFLLHRESKMLVPIVQLFTSVKNKTTAVQLTEQIARLCQKHGIQTVTIKVPDSSTIDIVLSNNQEAILTTKKDLEMQIASLQLTISRLTIEGKTFRRIDFRFDRPVVSF
ncbi:MAG: hypothetical protein ACREGI_01870 [Candidatus Levyibacteriota bacterium]